MIRSQIIRAFSALFLFQQARASGYLDLSLKSEFNVKGVVNISSALQHAPLLIPFIVSQNSTEKIPKIPINFNENEYHLTIFVENENQPDIDNSTITATFSPTRGILSPLTVMFPFIGVKINVLCESKWYGEKCDQFCCSETAERVGKVCNVHGQLACPDGQKGFNCGMTINKKWCKCKNDGKCVSSFGKNLNEKTQCDCPLGYTGSLCQKEVEAVELVSTYGVDPKKFRIGTAKMLYESVVDNEFAEVHRPHSTHILHNLRINDV
ncbi:unnamed protein product [Caenorhabditis sp. 36 PRJEB53466]|nr:unnamed protein product [Caenorhabditis sp. 36 PRJEB53466]